VLGAVAHATERVELMTYVTCPIMRCHPTVVAQQAATVGLLSGAQSCKLFAPLADHMIAVELNPELALMWDTARPGKGTSRRIGQLPICFDADRQAAIARAHEQFRWFGGSWKVNGELPSTAGFAAASQFVREKDIAERISCGPDVVTRVAAARPFAEAGFTHLALVQIGGTPEHPQPFLDYARDTLLHAMRAEFTPGQP
jgi:G6PDH family F420-dependent oxidoreductase